MVEEHVTLDELRGMLRLRRAEYGPVADKARPGERLIHRRLPGRMFEEMHGPSYRERQDDEDED